MCGIAGFFGARTVAPATLAAMLARLAPRGPDAQHAVRFDADLAQTAAAAPNALLHARLSIIDPRPEADQPMANAAGDIWICYNGEVYGWQDDARRLREHGFEFRTRSDTEFILHGYAAWGEQMLARLRGMFALAILDLRRRRLLLARDRLGKKPLLYYQGRGEFGFASTLRALLPYLPPGQRALDPDGIDAYLAHRYTPAPLTVCQHIRRLPSGHLLEYDLARGTLRQSAYWRPTATDGDWLATLDEAVKLRTVADRPVGLFLSGGIDSTLIASRLGALGCTQIRAFTAAFPGSAMDESRDAAQAAAVLGLPHTRVEVPASIRGEFPRIVADLDEPFADPSSFPLWYLARETTRQVKVVLGGDGGDELFAGYKRYARHLGSAWRRGWRAGSGRWPPAAEPRRLRRLLGELALSWEDAYSLRFSGMHPGLRRLLQPGLGELPAVRWRPVATDGLPPLEALLAIDLANYLPEYILRKGDLTTMAHGLELRAPLLDHVLCGTVLAMAPEQRFTRPPKLALAAACPPCRELGLFDRKKRGFNPPLASWLREDLRERFAGLGVRLRESSAGQLDAAAVDAVAATYLAGHEHLAEQVLQLLILDESLAQLAALAAEPAPAVRA
jgi:asparagine synthase (glutamine-hydrolysing)